MPTPEQLRAALAEVMDPELGVNVVDLGLVYDVALEQDRAHITMTMTSPACPLGGHIADEARELLLGRFPELREAEIELVFEPPWSPERMTDAARAQLGWPAP